MLRIMPKVLTIAVATAVWAAGMFGVFDKHVPAQYFRAYGEILPALPALALMLLGCYALTSVGWALYNFGDCPKAGEELQRDIADARLYLDAIGFRAPPPPAGWKA